MERKSLDPNNIWFVCDKCGTPYDDQLEEIIPPEKIKGSIEWANTPTKDKDKWDALTKLRIREEHETKKRESKRQEPTEFSKG